MSELIGETLPEAKIAISPGDEISIPNDFQDKWTILYFYPKDDTPGCTKQACTYQERMPEFTSEGVQVFGVSMDDIASHEAFQEKFSLQFPLIADTDGILSNFLGVYGDQEWQGKVFKGLSRDSFLIDPAGKVAHVWRGVHPVETVQETLNLVREKKSQ